MYYPNMTTIRTIITPAPIPAPPHGDTETIVCDCCHAFIRMTRTTDGSCGDTAGLIALDLLGDFFHECPDDGSEPW